MLVRIELLCLLLLWWHLGVYNDNSHIPVRSPLDYIFLEFIRTFIWILEAFWICFFPKFTYPHDIIKEENKNTTYTCLTATINLERSIGTGNRHTVHWTYNIKISVGLLPRNSGKLILISFNCGTHCIGTKPYDPEKLATFPNRIWGLG